MAEANSGKLFRSVSGWKTNTCSRWQNPVFYSKRTDQEGDSPFENSRIWYVIRIADTWSTPRVLSFDKSLGSSFYADHYASDGLYYFSVKIAPPDYGIYLYELVNDQPINIKRLAEPESEIDSIELGATTNNENSVLVYQTVNTKGENESILRACLKQTNDEWSDPKPLPDKINQGITRFASFSRDGKYLFFSSDRSGTSDIYWVDAKIIERFSPTGIHKK